MTDPLLRTHYEKFRAARARSDELLVRRLLERWVSELEPAIVYRDGNIIGLTVAAAPLGSTPFVLAVEDDKP